MTYSRAGARPGRRALPCICIALLLASLPSRIAAQTIDDGVMMTRHVLLVADRYSHDSWTQYWEGGRRNSIRASAP